MDLHYACDPAWWDLWGPVASRLPCPSWTQDKPAAEKWNINWIDGTAEHQGISLDPRLIHYNSNSGAQLLNIAVLCGFSRLLLLGYDMQPVDGKKHFFGDHPGAMNMASSYASWCHKFQRMLPQLQTAGVEVINCTKGSALTCFPQRHLEDFING